MFKVCAINCLHTLTNHLPNSVVFSYFAASLAGFRLFNQFIVFRPFFSAKKRHLPQFGLQIFEIPPPAEKMRTRTHKRIQVGLPRVGARPCSHRKLPLFQGRPVSCTLIACLDVRLIMAMMRTVSAFRCVRQAVLAHTHSRRICC